MEQLQQQRRPVLQRNKKVGAVITIIGRRGEGKTPVIKKLIENSKIKNRVVYDRRGEYDPKEYTIFYTLEAFRKFFSEVQQSFIIVEEATGFVHSFKDLELTDQMIGVEHRNNILVFIFHSLVDAPEYILRNSSFVILFNTNDDPAKVKTLRNKFYPFLSAAKPVFIDVNRLS